ncbi:MAG: OmpA family protein [Pseudomonadota bacterium]
MTKSLLKASAAVAALALAGCAGEIAGDQTDLFGSASATNLVTQAAYLDGGLLAQLSAQFRAAAPDMINFAFDSAELDAEARAILDQQAAWISANPQIRFRVYGHTDLVGSNAYNQRLGLRRARAAVNYLVARGAPRSRLEAVASFGETRPLINTQDRERLNRRTVTEVIGIHRGARVGDDLDGKVANGLYIDYSGDNFGTIDSP